MEEVEDMAVEAVVDTVVEMVVMVAEVFLVMVGETMEDTVVQIWLLLPQVATDHLQVSVSNGIDLMFLYDE